MIQRMIRTGWCAFLTAALMQAGGTAQTAEQGICRYVAVEARAVDVAEVKAAVKRHRDELADVRVKMMSGRASELGAWEARVDDIRVFASAVAFASEAGLRADGEALLADLAVTRAQAYATLGRYQAAREALEHLLIRAEDPVLQGRAERFASAPPALLALAREAALDPRIAEIRVDLSVALGAAEPAADDLDETLREAVRMRDWKLVTEVGTRAVPALKAAVLAGLDEFPDDVTEDPLYYLIKISERSGAMFALENCNGAGFAFRRRVLRAMDAVLVLQFRKGVWGDAPSELEPRPCLVPEWPKVVAELLADPSVTREAMPSLLAMLVADGVTPEVTAAVRVVLSADPGLASDLLRVLAESRVSPKGGKLVSAFGIYELLVTHPDPAVRRVAGAKLAEFPASQALWSRANDPDSLVRMSVAESLHEHRGRVPPRIDANALAALRVLLGDTDADIRAVAVQGLVELPAPLEPALYRKLVADPSPAVRAALVNLDHPEEALLGELLTSLAADSDALVREKFDARLLQSLPAATFLGAARLRLVGPARSENQLRNLIIQMSYSQEGTLALLDCAANEADAPLRAAIWGNRSRLTASTGSGMAAALALDDARLARVLVRASLDDERAFVDLQHHVRTANPPRWSAMLPVIADAGAPVRARLFAAACAAPGGGDEFRTATLALLGGEPLRSRELAPEEQKEIGTLMDLLPVGQRNALVLGALADAKLRDPVRAVIAGFYEPQAPGGRDVTLQVLARWLDAGAPKAAEAAMNRALRHLSALPEDVDPALFERAVRRVPYALAALQAIASLQDPRYLPAIQSALNPSWIPDGRYKQLVVAAAVEALVACPGDAATEVLLDAMVASPSEEVRNKCSVAVDQRRQALEQRAAWQRAKEVKIAEADAVARLVGLLQDDDAAIRVQAARGLATLRAVEALPLLIEALRDENAAVREAVSAALDRLNATAAERAGD